MQGMGGGVIVVHWNQVLVILKVCYIVMVGVVLYRIRLYKYDCFFIPCNTGHDYRTFGSKSISLKLASTIN